MTNDYDITVSVASDIGCQRTNNEDAARSVLPGDPDVRRRSEEFAARGGPSGPELAARLQATVAGAVVVIEALPAERLADRIVIQGYDVAKLEAVLHVLEHFAQHTGQILFATKAVTGADLCYYAHLDKLAPRQDPNP